MKCFEAMGFRGSGVVPLEMAAAFADNAGSAMLATPTRVSELPLIIVCMLLKLSSSNICNHEDYVNFDHRSSVLCNHEDYVHSDIEMRADQFDAQEFNAEHGDGACIFTFY